MIMCLDCGCSKPGTTRIDGRAADEVKSPMPEAAFEAGGSTLREHRQADGALGSFQHAFDVYDREGAACQHAGCRGTIARFVQGGRSTFWCGACQK